MGQSKRPFQCPSVHTHSRQRPLFFMRLRQILLICLALVYPGQAPADSATPDQNPRQTTGAAQVQESPALPFWESLYFEEKAFWATAKARLSVPTPAAGAQTWKLTGEGSIESTSELIAMDFDPHTAQLRTRERLSKGRREQRYKDWEYRDGFIIRKRRNPPISVGGDPAGWPVNHARRVYYPDYDEALPVTSEYLLLLLASRLAKEEPGTSRDVLVHTDLNFFLTRLTVVPGKTIERNYTVTGSDRVRGPRESTAVSIKTRPIGRQEEKPDFSLLGLDGDITVYFDPDTGLPLQLHGDAPRLGTTNIHLRGMTPRRPAQ